MSLYGALFGVEPTARIALQMLGISRDAVPRFRDAYFSWGDETSCDPVIVVLTRTGGGNRPWYESAESCRRQNGEAGDGPWNADLRALPGYREDRDVDFDATFAEFVFTVPEGHRPAVVSFLQAHGKPKTLREKFEGVIAELKTAPGQA